VLELLAARDLVDLDDLGFTREVLIDEWRVSSFDPAADAVVAAQDAAVVGYGAVFEGGTLAFVDPGREGEGVGSALLAWVQERAVELGRPSHRQRVAARNVAAQRLFQAAGYRRVRSVWQLRRDLSTLPPLPDPPDGITLHELDPERDAAELHALDDRAFADSLDYTPASLQSFHDEHLASEDLDPSLSRVARRGGAAVGFTLCRRRGRGVGYVDILGVDPAEQGRGVGHLLLLSSFTAFAAAGLREAQLEVISDNPRALRLYERVGMTRGHHLEVFEKPIDRAVSPRPAEPAAPGRP
jgi:mycothiol synthase